MPNPTTQKPCRQCQQLFTITTEDLAFYDKISPVFGGKKQAVPPPTLCPDCRTQRRFSFRNERYLYKTKSALSGKEIVSNIHPENPWKIYTIEEWFGDTWNGTDYGRPYDFNRPFLQQLKELQREIPMLNVNIFNSENCEYCNYLGACKNSYLIFGSVYSEDCYYGNPYYSQSCVDSLLVRNSELCYECTTCDRCYECFFCQDCVGSQNLILCYDCQSSKNCIGCVGLRNKEYYIFNKPYSKEEYEKILQSINFCNVEKMQEIRLQFEKLKQEVPHKFSVLVNTENCTGDAISQSKNSLNCYDIQRCEDIKNCAQVIDHKDCHDCNYTEENELCYEYIANYKNSRCHFSVSMHNCHEIWYSQFCVSSQNLFGCIGMKNKKYCILNKEYTKEEYEKLVPQIIENMKKEGLWGEFPDSSLSYFSYNETVAQEYFPLTEEEAKSRQYRWREKDPTEYKKQTYKVPANIQEVPNEVIQEILACVECEKNFKLIPQEIKFYKKYNLPLPQNCPNCRHKKRFLLRNPRKLYSRQCAKCQTPIQTTYAPNRPEVIYCEACYLQEVY